MKWIEFVVKTIPKNEYIVSDILYQAGAVGLAIEDPQDYIDLSENEESWDFIDDSLLDFFDDNEEITLKAYFPQNEDIERINSFIKNRLITIPLKESGSILGGVTLNSIDDEDFAENWKKYYKPLRIGKKIIIKPSWEVYEEKEDDIVIDLDPGMAFGTGTHETTYMCIEALESFIRVGDLVYDIGCGSGILSVVAAKLGAEKVVGIDIDPVCIDVSKENIRLNSIDDKVQVYKGDLFEFVDDKADLIVSNIIAETIIDMVKELHIYLKNDGTFIASGIILSKVESVEDALTRSGFKILNTKTLGEWACIIAQK